MLFDLWTAFGGVSYFGSGNWFDQSTTGICDYFVWGGFLCGDGFNAGPIGAYKISCVTRIAFVIECAQAPLTFCVQLGH